MVVITATSFNKGGTGKSSVIVNASIYLAYRLRKTSKYPVVLLDVGLDAGTTTLLILEDPNELRKVQYTIVDYLSGRVLDPLSLLYVKSWNLDGDSMSLVFAPSKAEIPPPSLTTYHKGLLSRLISKVVEYVGCRVLLVDLPAQPPRSPLLNAVLEKADMLIPIVTPDLSAVNSVANGLEYVRRERPSLRILRPILNMFSSGVEPTTGKSWVELVGEMLGDKPHVVPFDRSFVVARQALVPEILRLSPVESPALSSLLEYFRYLESLI